MSVLFLGELVAAAKDEPCAALGSGLIPHDGEILRETSWLAAALSSQPRAHPARMWVSKLRGTGPIDDPIEGARILGERMDEFVTLLRHEYTSCEVAFVVELGHDTDVPHAHAVAFGGDWHRRTLRAVAAGAGLYLGMKDDEVRDSLYVARYSMKLWIASLIMPPEDAKITLELGHALNRGRHLTATEGFLAPAASRRREVSLARRGVRRYAARGKHSAKLPALLASRLSPTALALEGSGASALREARPPPVTRTAFAEGPAAQTIEKGGGMIAEISDQDEMLEWIKTGFVDPDEREVVVRILGWLDARGLKFYIAGSLLVAAFFPGLPESTGWLRVCCLERAAIVSFRTLKGYPPFVGKPRAHLMKDMRQGGFARQDGFGRVDLATLRNELEWRTFEWRLERVAALVGSSKGQVAP